MAYGNPDVYYQPEAFGLQVVAQLDLSIPDYSFDVVVVWEHKESGVLYWAHDSGCSCPSPFEEYQCLEDLNLLFSDNYEELRRFTTSAYDSVKRGRFLNSVSARIGKLEEAAFEESLKDWN